MKNCIDENSRLCSKSCCPLEKNNLKISKINKTFLNVDNNNNNDEYKWTQKQQRNEWDL